MTEEKTLYVGKGNASMQDEYVDFINYVFGFNGCEKNFYNLLPKLYKPEYDPAGNSYVVLEDDKLKAAVGAFTSEIEVMGERLVCRGIGNVAVHPFSRGQGYMKDALGMAVDDMVKDGVDLSILGGLRARYNYFSFERAGAALSFRLGSDAMRHRFGKDRTPRFRYQPLTPRDTELLDRVAALSDARPFHPIRPREQLYDILVSWMQRPFAVLDGDRFVGYVVCGDGVINEIALVNDGDFIDAVVGVYDLMQKKEICVLLPPFRPEYVKQIHGVAESYEVICPKMFSVLSYERVIRAFLKLKASYEALPDGELTLLIHGRAGDEALSIAVRDGVPFVKRSEGPCALTLDHRKAMNLLFASFDPDRSELPVFARLWLPLPIYMYSSDID